MPSPETDPNGFDPHHPGAKLDSGKNRLGLVLGGFARALTEVGKVGTYGAKKYTDNGWEVVPDGESRYTDALLRHLLSEYCGEGTDIESNLSHAAHAAWNALARLELAIRREQVARGGETQEQVRDICTGVPEAEQEPCCGVRAGEVGVHGPLLGPPVYPRYKANTSFWNSDIYRTEGEAGHKHEKEDGPRQGPASG